MRKPTALGWTVVGLLVVLFLLFLFVVLPMAAFLLTPMLG